MPRLNVLIASTRPERVGLPVANWFAERVRAQGHFELVVTDLKELALPLLDEPKHPRLGQYVHEHTRAWSARVKASDAFVFVTPEYNHGSPPALINALDYLFAEWQYKAVGFVSYGGVSGGTRSVQMTKPIVVALKMTPLVEAVTIPFVANQLAEDGSFRSSEALEKAASAMLNELARVTDALAPLRA